MDADRFYKASNTRVCIFVIAEGQEHTVRLANTLSDNALKKSLISRAKALATHGPIQSKSPTVLTDHSGTTYTSTSTISLRWYYDDGLQTFQESFYIVDRLSRATGEGGGSGGDWDAILRADIEPGSAVGQAYPYCTIPAGQDPRREAERRERQERGLKQFQAQKEDQQKKIREGLTKGSKQNTKR
ncbi:hypothetical protein A1O1_04885 [Capronia coronata CBS 617.96]|uniref:Uncharacterized protein n=1 Tax=Capronia coronata CBS 617.96 TaxID=1182541 RepID=W9Y603_9EURO|nr:uncharacterized protein A1O1_04885 [Capronia coronata CBS 617.96]EXJ87958.1 hypothetical protein A1O1_04885 [Capronia coronata CBS 617.96]